ncbi:thrombospondin [Micromonospora echinaurantiaca]|uniref:thrombospondin n=1 Tax=Micromonospora echinaurantiaca TaxID=47857 RepID=UPI0037948E12
MVKIPSLSRRSEPVPERDENLDERDTTAAAGRDRPTNSGAGRLDGRGSNRSAVSDRDEATTYRSGAATATVDDRDPDAERRATERAAVARAATGRPTDEDTRPSADPTLERTVDRDRDGTAVRPTGVDQDGDGVPDRAERPVVAGPKPRASLLATLGLIVGVAGVLFVLTGTLTGYGIGLGAVGAVLAVLGLVATRRRHIAGKTDALFGVVFGLGAVVLGVLAMTGQFDWPTTDGDWVQRFREWLDSQFVDRF